MTINETSPLTATPAKRQYRRDIQGLRSVAVLPVVLFHAGVLAIPGGFLGVDVFFVISGFLITGHLLREAEATGKVHLLAFWGRRLRRLFPVLMVVTMCTVIASCVVLSPLEWNAVALQAFAGLVSASNVLFASEATNYFAADQHQSPLLHTWSLGLEEQFYFLLPFVVIAAWWVATRFRRSGRSVLATSLVLAFLVSFAASVTLTAIQPIWAFYTLPTRIWEFAAGGLIAVFATRVPTVLAATSTWLGLVILGAGYVLVSDQLPFPGAIALIPVLGTVFVLIGGWTSSLPSRFLGSSLMQWVGARSYSWYLWHWPVIVLTMAALGSDSVLVGLIASAVSLGLAAITYRFVEVPLRFHPRLTGSSKSTYIFVGSLVALGALGAVAVIGAGAIGSKAPSNQAWHAAREESPPDACPENAETDSGLQYCAAGNLDSDTTVLIIGDSHAAQWVPALATIATQDGFELAIATMNACPAATVSVATSAKVLHEPCDAFHAESSVLLVDLQPEVVIIASSGGYVGRILDGSNKMPSEEAQTGLWANGYSNILTESLESGAVVAAIEDNPHPSGDAAICVTRPGGTVEACSPTRSEAFEGLTSLFEIERSVREGLGVVDVYSVADDLCDVDVCKIVDNDVPVYKDLSHLSQKWTATQVDDLREFVRGILLRSP